MIKVNNNNNNNNSNNKVFTPCVFQYFESQHEQELQDLKKHQQLLDGGTIALLRSLIAREKVSAYI